MTRDRTCPEGRALTQPNHKRKGVEDNVRALRQFRDGWLSRKTGGWASIRENYALAPDIVAAIPPDDPEFLWITSKINLAVEAIHGGEPANAFDIYAGTVRRLQERWL